MTATQEIVAFLNIDKPEGWTSHDVVAKLRRLLKIKQIGHAGTLDPFATGVLPLAIGNATRLMRFLPKTKKYSAELDLSFTTDTDDYTGQKLRETSKYTDQETFKQALATFIGEIDQIPPLYSAKKVNGKKLYELMREGHPLDLSELVPKKIHIYNIDLINFDFPKTNIVVSCGEGTYIRSIARDLGGHLTQLRRLESNGFTIESAFRFEDLEEGELEVEDLFLKVQSFLKLPNFVLNNKELIAFQQGQAITLPEDYSQDLLKEGLIAGENFLQCLDQDMELIGLANILKTGSYLTAQPKVVL